tara:strand:+ start:1272 stop:1481 length:210 start_codon:yes stop_codon:yes gene_type:complete
MKFTYDTDKPETRECVAYIDKFGHLLLKDTIQDGHSLALTAFSMSSWDQFDLKDATHKFYKGDSVTITF